METILSILFIAFIVFFSIQFCYYGFVFSRFAFAKPQAGTPKKIPVSVIIWAKNECENLISNNLIYGCGKPFKIIKNSENIWIAIEYDYI